MSGQVRAAGNVLQPPEALAGEPSGNTGKLADGTQLGKPLTREAEDTDVLRLVGRRQRRRLEALLREVGAAIDIDLLLGVCLDVVENLAEQLVGETQQAGGGGHVVGSRGVGVGVRIDRRAGERAARTGARQLGGARGTGSLGRRSSERWGRAGRGQAAEKLAARLVLCER